MKRSSNVKRSMVSLYVLVIFLSILIIFGIFEFRFLNNILNSYENSIEQIAINKTNSFFNSIKAVSENGARKIELQNISYDKEAVQNIASYDRRISNVYLTRNNGTIIEMLNEVTDTIPITNFALGTKNKKKKKVQVSDLYYDEFSNQNIVRTATPLSSGGVLVIDFRIDDYIKEIIEEFSTTNFKIAVFDSKNTPVIWPFAKEQITNFDPNQSKFFLKNEQYHVVSNKVSPPQWQIYLFKKDTNFEQYRAITIIFLVFALYYCIYQLLVEFWGVNSAKTYFDNIDFAILNQINEGVIITNNAGVIVFANKAAHEFFSDRKRVLINVKLKEIMGHIGNLPDQSTSSQTMLLKTSDKILETIHSPIIKKGKKLGSLNIIRVNVSEEKSFKNVFQKLLEVIPEGVIYVDEKNEIVTANLMAKCHLGTLDHGKGIEAVDTTLAEAIRKNIDSHSINRIELTSYHTWCDIAPVYDSDGVYIGSLIVLWNNEPYS